MWLQEAVKWQIQTADQDRVRDKWYLRLTFTCGHYEENHVFLKLR